MTPVRRHPLYLLFGTAVVGAALAAEWRGWAPARAARGVVAPRSVRENPGAYRTVYRGSYRYVRGK